MSSSSNRLSYPGHIKVKEKIPYAGKGHEILMATLARVLADNKLTQKVVLEVGVPYIYIEKLVPEDMNGAPPQLSFYDAFRGKPMEEYRPEEKQAPLQQLWEVFSVVHAEGLEVGFVLVGDKQAFQTWLKVRIPVTRLSVFGVPLKQLPEIPTDVFIVCGTTQRESEPEDIQFSVKGVIT